MEDSCNTDNAYALLNRACWKKTATFRLSREDALRYLGYREHHNPDPGLMQKFERLAQACEQENSVTFTWRIFETIPAEDGLVQSVVRFADTPLALPGKSIAHHLRGALFAACLACTLGFANERELKRVAAQSTTDGVIYDACSSALIEAGADAAQEDIARAVKESGLHVGLRFSPGYGDLPLSVQPAFLEALEATRAIGVSLTSEHLMVPTKSITAICGLYPFEPPKRYTSPCSACALRANCNYLAKGMTCYD